MRVSTDALRRLQETTHRLSVSYMMYLIHHLSYMSFHILIILFIPPSSLDSERSTYERFAIEEFPLQLARAGGRVLGSPSPSMAPWLTRAEREASGRPKTPKTLRSSGKQASSSSSSPLASTGAPSPRALKRRQIGVPSPRAPKRQQIQTGASAPCQVESIEDLVVPASETRVAHLRRHGGGRRTCPRCRYYLHGAAWTATYGSCMAPTGPRRRVVWLAERPARQGEAWALGCVFCASYECRSAGASTLRRGPSTRRRGGFGGYSVRYRSLQAENIRFHEHSLGHKFAQASWFWPDDPVCVTLQATMEDDRLLSGHVPQPQDWLRAWRICRDPRSWQAAEHDDVTSNFICQIRPLAVQRKSWKALCVTMAEVVRNRKREALRVATTVSIAFDDKASRKLLMFKCDTPGLPSVSCLDADKTLLPYGARLAMIGCMPPDLPKMSEYDDDYASRTASAVVKLFERFCTHRGELDRGLLESLLLKVRVVCVDGALIKTATVLRASRPNSVLVVRDPAHVIRTSTAPALHKADLFEEQYSRLFSSRHAVLKDFMNSQIWQDQLQACQADILESGGSLGGGVKSVLRNMAFVQPRFESEATPRRRYICMLRAIA